MAYWCNDIITKIGVTLGAVVTIQIDSWDVSHPHGIIGILYDLNASAGGELVICLSELIFSTSQKVGYWIPVDRYNVVAKAE
jgi:hypothetical protein